MNRLDHDQTSEHDAGLDTFLTEFYQHELPDELAHTSNGPVASASAPTLETSRSQRRGFVGAAIVAASLLAAFSAFRADTHRNQRPSPPTLADKNPIPRARMRPHPGDAAIKISQPATVTLGATDNSVSDNSVSDRTVSEQTVPIERFQYDTSDGPVEQRTDLKTTSVSVFDPQTGTKVEVTLPELTIEIFPIDDDDEKEK